MHLRLSSYTRGLLLFGNAWECQGGYPRPVLAGWMPSLHKAACSWLHFQRMDGGHGPPRFQGALLLPKVCHLLQIPPRMTNKQTASSHRQWIAVTSVGANSLQMEIVQTMTQAAWDNTYSLFFTFNPWFHLVLTQLMCHEKRSLSEFCLLWPWYWEQTPILTRLFGGQALLCSPRSRSCHLQTGTLQLAALPFHTCRGSAPPQL